MEILAANAILCDYVQDTGIPTSGPKKNVLGVVGTVLSSTYPVNGAAMWLYVRALLDGLSSGGTVPFAVELRGPSQEPQRLIDGQIRWHASGPGTAEIGLQLSGLNLRTPGIYYVVVFFNNQEAAKAALEARLYSPELAPLEARPQ
jgi:hypothetical protein